MGDQQTGHVQLINQKSYSTNSKRSKKYTNFVYSSIFSYEARSIYQNYNCDNALTFSKDGVKYDQRQAIINLYCQPNFAASKYNLNPSEATALSKRQDQSRWQKPKAKLKKLKNLLVFRKLKLKPTFPSSRSLGLGYTYILGKDDFMLNVHRIETNQSLVFKEGGYPLGFDQGGVEILSTQGAEAALKDDKFSFLRNLYGYTQQFPARPFGGDIHGSNIRYSHSVVPALGYENGDQTVFYLACMVYGRIGHADIEQLMHLVTDFRIEQGIVQVTFYDAERVVMQLGEIKALDLTLNGKQITGKVVMARVSAEAKNYFILNETGEVQSS